MNRWEHDIQTVTRSEITRYCVRDKEWQHFRINVLKGQPTISKLALLEAWREQQTYLGSDPRRVEVQIDNYINALKRGGQLDLEGNVVR